MKKNKRKYTYLLSYKGIQDSDGFLDDYQVFESDVLFSEGDTLSISEPEGDGYDHKIFVRIIRRIYNIVDGNFFLLLKEDK